MNQRRIPELESLRGLMAGWVMLGHIWLTIPQDSPSLIGAVLSRNGQAVLVFVILSGFVIFNLLDTGRDRLVGYIVRRFCRIFPAYLVLLLASLALLDLSMDVLSNPLWRSVRNAQRIRILEDTQAYLWPHLAAHLLLVHGMIPDRLLPSAEYAILGQAWSISLEWQFYLVAPFCFRAIAWCPVRGTLLVLGAALFAHFSLRYFAGEGFLPAAAGYFIIGAASYFVWRDRERFAAGGLAVGSAVAATLALLFDRPAVGIWCAVLGLLLLSRQERAASLPAGVSRLLQHPMLVWLGTISYSLYLVHMIPIVLAMALMPAGFTGPFRQGVWLFATVVPASLLLSWLLFHTVERPGIAFGQHLVRRPEGVEPEVGRGA